MYQQIDIMRMMRTVDLRVMMITMMIYFVLVSVQSRDRRKSLHPREVRTYWTTVLSQNFFFSITCTFRVSHTFFRKNTNFPHFLIFTFVIFVIFLQRSIKQYQKQKNIFKIITYVNQLITTNVQKSFRALKA